MIDNIREKLRKLFEKIPESKRPIVLVVVGLIAMSAILFSSFDSKSSKDEKKTSAEAAAPSYTEETERKLENIISLIDGAGRCKVMVTLDTSEENIYASDINDGKSEYVVIKTSSDEGGLLLKIVQPKIRGVAVVCDGGDSYITVNNITEAVCSALGISSTKVSITKMKN
ncbi:MAG: hypothetical protein ACI4GA_01985 [Acutalibacteraceae bacterium]|nr:hypothetical protein [Oscillospiraceae bacterium]